MTNIMAYVKKGEMPEGKQLKFNFGEGPFTFNANFGVVAADGLASDGVEATPGYQKIFPVGRNYLLGTGAGDKIQFIAGEFERDDETTPKRLAERIIEVTKKHVCLEPQEGLNFIVAGYYKKTPELYHVKTNRITKPIPGENILIDGSGSQFVAKAWSRDQQRGWITDPQWETIADVTTKLFDLAYVAKSSAGVNDQIQFGFMLPEGNATLLHPQVNISHPTKEYVDEQGNLSMPKVERNTKFYDEFTQKLIQNFRTQRQCNQIHTALVSNDPTMKVEEAQEFLLERFNDLAKIKDEINRMICAYVLRNKS